jgi:hypothetical protein
VALQLGQQPGAVTELELHSVSMESGRALRLAAPMRVGGGSDR